MIEASQPVDLSESLALATGVHDGLAITAEDGRALAILATAPFPDHMSATVFAAWLRDTLSDPERLAETLAVVTGGTPPRAH